VGCPILGDTIKFLRTADVDQRFYSGAVLKVELKKYCTVYCDELKSTLKLNFIDEDSRDESGKLDGVKGWYLIKSETFSPRKNEDLKTVDLSEDEEDEEIDLLHFDDLKTVDLSEDEEDEEIDLLRFDNTNISSSMSEKKKKKKKNLKKKKKEDINSKKSTTTTSTIQKRKNKTISTAQKRKKKTTTMKNVELERVPSKIPKKKIRIKKKKKKISHVDDEVDLTASPRNTMTKILNKPCSASDAPVKDTSKSILGSCYVCGISFETENTLLAHFQSKEHEAKVKNDAKVKNEAKVNIDDSPLSSPMSSPDIESLPEKSPLISSSFSRRNRTSSWDRDGKSFRRSHERERDSISSSSSSYQRNSSPRGRRSRSREQESNFSQRIDSKEPESIYYLSSSSSRRRRKRSRSREIKSSSYRSSNASSRKKREHWKDFGKRNRSRSPIHSQGFGQEREDTLPAWKTMQSQPSLQISSSGSNDNNIVALSNGVGRGRARTLPAWKTKQQKTQPSLQIDSTTHTANDIESVKSSIENNSPQRGVIYKMDESNNMGMIRPSISQRAVLKFYFYDTGNQLGQMKPGTVVEYKHAMHGNDLIASHVRIAVLKKISSQIRIRKASSYWDK